MGEQEKENKPKKHICAALLAHVDAGKTTLSEAMLFLSGSIRRLGRVDKKDAFLDNYHQERERGITIFSKQAHLVTMETEITLLDTPGHVDFSPEMERTLTVLDVAILVISGSDGIQGHTLTLWRLLTHYQVPVFLFINKMDQPDTDKEKILRDIQDRFGDSCVDFTHRETEGFYESIAFCDEEVFNELLETGEIKKENIKKLIRERKIFPCFFGSALKLFGVEELLEGLDGFTVQNKYPKQFGARVFKITRDGQGNRLTHMKITGGNLKAKMTLSGVSRRIGGREERWEEKVNQIRIYFGEKFENTGEAAAGSICAVTGLTQTWAGQGLGIEKETVYPELSPVLTYDLLLPKDCDLLMALAKLRQLEEEDPQFSITWDEKNKVIKAGIMGQVQIEVYKSLIQERFGLSADFGTGSIIYKETIANAVEGVGHFEPLRHYAEVHLLLEPGEPGSGLQIGRECSEDLLDLNWQRLILTHLEEKEHVGVLMGAPVTDMKITLRSGRAHQKHTEGGDFRQATYRALRQGLMQAENVLLEPYYEFRLEAPKEAVGRAMTDLDKRCGRFTLEQDGSLAVLKGTAPMASLQDYQKEVASYTRGLGQLYVNFKGYYPCHNTEEVLEKTDYDPLRDTENPASSVFCAHGAGFVVEWDKVFDYMHMDSVLDEGNNPLGSDQGQWDLEEAPEGEIYSIKGSERSKKQSGEGREASFIGQDEVEAILKRTFHANKKDDGSAGIRRWGKNRRKEDSSGEGYPKTRVFAPVQKKEAYLLVDGYNVIFAWEELEKLAKLSLDGARGKLLDMLCNYQAVKGCSLIAVFDAYRLEGHPTEILDYHNIHVVYTKEAETADQYIEKFAHENSHRYDVTVATSDGLEQIIIMGEGCKRMSSRELKEELEGLSAKVVEDYQRTNPDKKISLGSVLPKEAMEEMNQFKENYQE